MPAVCSNRVRRSTVSAQPKRSAMPGRYQTGSIAILDNRDAAVGVHEVAVGLEPAGGERGLHLVQVEPRLGDGDGRADVDALGDLGLESLARRDGPRDRARRCGRGSLHCANGPMLTAGCGIGEVRPADRIERAGGHRERAIERIGAAVAADGVAVAGPRHRADDRAALARGRRAPVDREARLAAGLRMRGDADMVGSVRAIHFTNPKSHRPAAWRRAQRSNFVSFFGAPTRAARSCFI